MMTSIRHDESIEALHGNRPTLITMAENGHQKVPAPSSREEAKEMLPKTETETEKQQQLDHKKRIARIKKLVFIISAVLILMAIVLVGVTLFMAGHIDEEGELYINLFIKNCLCQTLYFNIT